MFPLQMTTTLTEDHFVAYTQMLFLKRRKAYLSVVLLVEFVIMAMLLLNAGIWQFFYSLLFFGFPAVLIWLIRQQARRLYRTNRLLQLPRVICFHEKSLEVTHQQAQVTYYYKDLQDVFEDKQVIYLMFGSYTGLILSKADCPPEVIEWLSLNLKLEEGLD